MANEKKSKSAKGTNKTSPVKRLSLSSSKSPKTKESKKVVEVKELPSPETPDDISDPSSPEEEPEKPDAELLGWPKEHDLELVERIKKNIPKDDTMKYDSRVNHLNWESIKFREYSAEACKSRWLFVQGHLRHYRLLTEVLSDAVDWTSHPWTNFNKGGKNQKHPEQPKKPLSSYMLFYMEQRDSILQKQPGLGMTELSKVVARMYHELSDRKKAKYVEMADREKEAYNEKMMKFIEDHPDVPASKQFKIMTTNKAVPPKLPTPFKLFCDAKLDKYISEGLTTNEAREKCRDCYKELTDKQKLKWIYQAIEKEVTYNEELEIFKSEYPDYEFPTKKASLLTKEELQIKQRNEGKPEKPPNSGYSLFSKTLLSSNALNDVISKDRMSEISRQWKELSDAEKAIYNEKALKMNNEYKERFATYLESLPPEKRDAEVPLKAQKRAGAENNTKAESKKLRTEPEVNSSDSEEEVDENEPEEVPPPKKSAIQKPKSSLQMFCDKNLKKYSAKHPGLSQQELSRLMAKEFAKLSPEKKKQYDNMAKQSKKQTPSKETAAEPEPPKPKKGSAKKEAVQEAVKVAPKAKPVPTLKAAKPAKQAKNARALPAWAANQHLYANEPPKPPETAAAYYAHTNATPGTIVTGALIDKMWKQATEKQKKKIVAEHKKKQQQYVTEFENFVRNLPTDKLKDFRAFMKNRENDRDYDKKASDDEDEEEEEQASSVEDAQSSEEEEENNSFQSSNDDDQALSSSDEEED